MSNLKVIIKHLIYLKKLIYVGGYLSKCVKSIIFFCLYNLIYIYIYES